MTEEVKPRGGKRRNSGRKTEMGREATVKKHTVTLDEKTVRMAKVIGGGELSRGIRAATRFTYDAYQADKFVLPEKE